MQAECNDILAELESWYAAGYGPYLLQATHAAVKDTLDTTFGYHLLQLGLGGPGALCLGSPINHRIVCAERPGGDVDLVAHADELPLESDSIDAVVAHHCIEFTQHPHQVLREVHRVLRPQGQLLLVGFNPYSLLGLVARVRGLARDTLWHQHRPVSEQRLSDWLHVLGCEVHATRICAVPPVGRGRVRQLLAGADAWTSRHNLPAGGIYILHAVKQVAGLHRPRRVFRVRRERLVGLVGSPGTRPISPSTQSFAAREERDVAA